VVGDGAWCGTSWELELEWAAGLQDSDEGPSDPCVLGWLFSFAIEKEEVKEEEKDSEAIAGAGVGAGADAGAGTDVSVAG
jgi:hypothetical protein